MDQLPSSIEAYLEEAGFSGTEILILRRLMDGEPLTIRQLGAKTGKSTGVLDQAMKKLMKKNIIKKTLINDAPKYTLDSLEAVVEWMQDDMEQKREMLLRRHQNFESFVTSLESGSKRPDIEYFEGDSGIKQAYIKLLNGPGEILHYLPVIHKEEEDPLRDFRVQYFRERQHRKMFSRVLAHDTPLGRRYQSRDAFEYRKTILISETEYPFTFEKIITGDRIACIDHKAKTACVIRYPELADVERTLFEAIWRQVQLSAAVPQEDVQKAITETKLERIALSTETLSQIREFFLSRRSLVAFGICAFFAAVITGALYWQNESLNKLRIHERIKSIAATAALQFSPVDLDQLRSSTDVSKPEYKKVIYQLNEIRRQNEGVKYVYLMRPTTEDKVWEFIADADGLNPFSPRDVNGDGVIDDMDHMSPPGEKYQDAEDEENSIVLDYATSYDIYTDQWGTVLTGTAPIRDADGNPIAILGVDVGIETLRSLQQASFTPFIWFLAFFFLFFLIRLAAFNRSLLRELFEIIRVRNLVILFGTAAITSIFATLTLYVYLQHVTLNRMQDRVLAIATTAAMQMHIHDLQELQVQSDYMKPEWAKTVNLLRQIQQSNADIMYVYIFRRSKKNPGGLEFISDSFALNPFANIDNDSSNDVDQNADGKIDGTSSGGDYLAWPGQEYPNPPRAAFESFNGLDSSEFYEDQYGRVVSGYAPLKDEDGNVVAVLAVDIRADAQHKLVNQVFTPIYAFFAFFLVFILFRISHFKLSLFYKLLKVLSKRVVILLLIFLLCLGFGSWKLYKYHQRNLLIEETGKRLMAIAATAAPTINPDDLEVLRRAGDMKRVEYQRIWKQLNLIRKQNPEILYVFIQRPTDDEDIWEFIADADSNYFLPEYYDNNNDGVLNESDENAPPGTRNYWPMESGKNALKRPYYELDTPNQWCECITGTAPIRDIKGNVIAIIGVDTNIDSYSRKKI